MAGRVLRPHPGGVDARIIDHSGVVHRHGSADDEIARAPTSDEKAVNKSAETHAAVHRRELATCPRCRRSGWKVKVATPADRSRKPSRVTWKSSTVS